MRMTERSSTVQIAMRMHGRNTGRSQTRRRMLLICVGVLGVFAAFAFTAQARMLSVRRSLDGTYVAAKMGACLHTHGVTYGIEPTSGLKPSFRKLYPPGLTTELSIIGYGPPGTPQPPNPGPKIDSVTLEFFRTTTLAKKGEAKIVAIWIYGKGTGLPPPPTQAVARTLFRLQGNVVVLWEYPRYYPAASDKILNACFAATR
jgi:hypothetical protein